MKTPLLIARLAPLVIVATVAVVAVVHAHVALPNPASAQDSPSVTISLSPSGSVEPGTAITAAMSFSKLASDSETTDYIFRADVVDSGNGDADGCEGDGMGQDRYMYQVDEDPESRATTVSADCPVGDYTVRASLSSAEGEELAAVTADFSVAALSSTEEPCAGSGYHPVPMAVEVEAVPIAVESTTDEYFVLYVRHELDGDTTLWIPVSATRGGAGTTTLTENVAALPKERYRVEKFRVADPADVDGDCIDDLTELADPVGMNPVNPAAAIDINDGAVAVPDRATFERLSDDSFRGSHTRGKSYVKFVLLDTNTDRPRVYFQNTRTHRIHLSFLDAFGLEPGQDGLLTGTIAYDPELVAPDGSPGVYYFWSRICYEGAFSLVARLYTLLAASMPVLDDNLTVHLSNDALQCFRSDLPLYRESRIDVVFDEDIFPETGYLALNPGEGYGLLRVMEPDERPSPRDVVIYEALPNELPRVAGIVSAVPQTPLSHVNLRAVQDRVPNALVVSRQ